MARRRIVSFGVDPSEINAVLKELPLSSTKRARSALKDSGRLFQKELVKSFRPRGSQSDEWLQARTGNLRRSIGYQVSGDKLSDLTLAVFSAGTSYANLQENGGTITPKNGKYLTIPIKDNLTPAGVPRYPSARDLRAQLNTIGPAKPARRGRKDKLAGARTFLVPASRANAKADFYILLRLASGKTQLLWALVRKVTIPPRFGFRKTWNKQAAMRAELFSKAMEAAVNDAVIKARRTERAQREGEEV